MRLGIETFTLGVEEEYQIVDATSRALVDRQKSVQALAELTLGDRVTPELQRSQIEIATPVCSALAEVRDELVRARRALIDAAQSRGSRIAAAGTHPFSAWFEQSITPKDRYRELARDFGALTRETVIFGFHVHVGIAERDVALDVLNRVRSQLSPLLALAANSPFWLGDDTGYDSFRTEVWARWPLAGPPEAFASRQEYDGVVESLTSVGIIEDETKIYWDVRPSGRFPTLEFRVTDVCMTVDEAVTIAGLVRALARTAYLAGLSGAAVAPVRQELLRAAHWHAARYGLGGELVDVESARLVPARAFFERFVARLRPALEEAGDYDTVSAAVGRTLENGNGAARQRAAFAREGTFEGVVDYVVAQTALA